MDSLTTKGIQIDVKALYEPETSNPSSNKYVFSYHIEIFNRSKGPVQLIDRHWVIIDADNVRREVRGPGVIGLQPIIQPGESHSYNSWSVLRTPLGKMEGRYGMIDILSQAPFKVEIPAFKLVADFVFN